MESTKFTKNQIMQSKRFKKRRDILNALLDEDKTYTTIEVEKILNTKMKGKVQ